MFTSPKFKPNTIVYDKRNRLEGPCTVLSFFPDDDFPGYKNVIRDGGGKEIITRECDIVEEDKAFFLVKVESAFDDEHSDTPKLFTKKYGEAKKCFDTLVEKERAFEDEQCFGWEQESDANSFSAWEQGYYPTGHINIKVFTLELGDTD